MNFDKTPVNWFDLLVVIMILLGARQGRKNGMSVECLVAIQWIVIVAICTFAYLPFGDFLADMMPMSHLFCYITAYITLAMLVKISFSLIKKGLGGKMLGSDLFGRAEFYLGTLAGVVRFACILLAAIALLNARKYSSQEISAKEAYVREVYGSNFFPDLYAVQSQVFEESLSGAALKKYAPFLLIKPTLPEQRDIGRRKDDLP
jgi:hypothetical protein